MAENERSFLWCWMEGCNWPQSSFSIAHPVYDVGICCQSSYAVLITNMWWKWPRHSTKLISSLSHLGNFKQNAAVICCNSPCVQNDVNVFPTKWAVKLKSATFPKSQKHCWELSGRWSCEWSAEAHYSINFSCDARVRYIRNTAQLKLCVIPFLSCRWRSFRCPFHKTSGSTSASAGPWGMGCGRPTRGGNWRAEGRDWLPGIPSNQGESSYWDRSRWEGHNHLLLLNGRTEL